MKAGSAIWRSAVYKSRARSIKNTAEKERKERDRDKQTKRNSIFMICLISRRWGQRQRQRQQPESKHIFSSVATFDIDRMSTKGRIGIQVNIYTYIHIYRVQYIASNISTINERKNQLAIYCLKHKKLDPNWQRESEAEWGQPNLY